MNDSVSVEGLRDRIVAAKAAQERDLQRQVEARQKRKAANAEAKKWQAWREKVSNTWGVIHNDNRRITGLVHPETREEAEEEMERLRIEGTLLPRSEFEAHPVYRAAELRGRRASIQAQIMLASAEKLPKGAAIEMVKTMHTLKVDLPPYIKELMDRALDLVDFVETATDEELDNLDIDSQL